MTSAARINEILGARFTETEILDTLRRIAGLLIGGAANFVFTPPSWRRDLTAAEDLAEETGRFLGYDAIPERLTPLPPRAATLSTVETASRRARLRLCALGLCEAYNYDLLSEKALAACRLPAVGLPRVDNPLSEDWAVLRPSLLPGLLKNAQHNLSRGADAVRLFEVGKAYSPKDKGVTEHWRAAGLLAGPVMDSRWQPARAPRAGFADVKALVEALLEGTGAITWLKPGEGVTGRWAGDPLLHPAAALRALVDGLPMAGVGRLHPRAARAFDLERADAVVFELDLDRLASRPAPRARFRAFSPLPSSSRDLALVLDKAVPYAAVEETTRAAGIAELQEILLFDVYEGAGVPAGKKSLAVRLTFCRPDRTLTDAEVAGFVSAVVAALGARLGAALRG